MIRTRRRYNLTNDKQLIRNAVLNGDQLANEIIAMIDKLELEKMQNQESLKERQSVNKTNFDEHKAFYDFAKSIFNRNNKITSEIFQLIYDKFNLADRKPQIYLATIKRKRSTPKT